MALAEVAVLIHDAPGHRVHIGSLVIPVVGRGGTALVWLQPVFERSYDIVHGSSGAFELLQPVL